MPTLIAASELITGSFRNLSKNAKLFGKLALWFGLLGAIQWAIVSMVDATFVAGVGRSTVEFLATMPVWIMTTVMTVAAITATVRTLQDKKPAVSDCVSFGFHEFFSFAWVGFLSGLIVFGGLFLLVIPALIFACYVQFAPYILVQDGIRGSNAVRASWQAVSGRFWNVALRSAIPFLFFTVAAMLAESILFLLIGAVSGRPGILFGNVESQDISTFASFVATTMPYLMRGFLVPLYAGASLILWNNLKKTA